MRHPRSKPIRDPHGCGYWRYSRRHRRIQWRGDRHERWTDTADGMFITPERITTFMVLKANAEVA